ncbi:MAG: hypothetical protein ACK5LT_00035 [Lachnospirales bacterium]
MIRGLTVVTDDFIINFDYGKGDVDHNFQCLYHLQGLRSIGNSQGKKIISYKYTEQLDSSPLSSYQFITDCNWYKVDEGSVLDFLLNIQKILIMAVNDFLEIKQHLINLENYIRNCILHTQDRQICLSAMLLSINV